VKVIRLTPTVTADFSLRLGVVRELPVMRPRAMALPPLVWPGHRSAHRSEKLSQYSMNAAYAASRRARNSFGSIVRRSSHGPAHKAPSRPARSSTAAARSRTAWISRLCLFLQFGGAGGHVLPQRLDVARRRSTGAACTRCVPKWCRASSTRLCTSTRHRGFDWLIFSHLRMGSSSGERGFRYFGGRQVDDG